MKEYIIRKLIGWLDLKHIQQEITTLTVKTDKLEEENKSLRLTNKYMENQITNLNKLLDIGVDMGVRDHKNWAVVCIEGKPNYVKFVDLGRSDVREVQQFLRQFDSSNRIVDAPYNMDFLFNDNILWDRR